MINLNKYRLVPDREIGGMAAWGSIVGDIDKQEDLMSLLSSYATESWVSSNHFATQTWVSSQGYLTSIPDYYATKSWVSNQGYLTSIPDYYATKSWVSDQGFLTSETLPSDIATEEWVSSQGYLTSVSTTITDIDSRLSSIETTLGQAVTITNNILS